ncbi:MAG: preprotein translocase subunit YajC [Firmicutes bacterium]|nr:preprotein translocase subunit YajC [Bacillota bacterium]
MNTFFNSIFYATSDVGGTIMLSIAGVAIIAFMFIVPVRRRKKQNEYISNLHQSVQVGCIVKTLGGLIGKVVGLNEKQGIKEVVIETGIEPNKATLVFDFMYIYAVLVNADGTKHVQGGAKTTSTTQNAVSVKIESDVQDTQEQDNTAKMEEIIVATLDNKTTEVKQETSVQTE